MNKSLKKKKRDAQSTACPEGTRVPRISRRGFGKQLLLATAALGLAPSLLRRTAAAQSPAPLKIGIIGSGRIGGSVGLRWAEAGHEILFASRNPDELGELVAQAGPRARAGLPREAAEFGDIVFIAVPYAAMPQVGQDYAELLQGKIVIDCGNPYVQRDGEMAARALAQGTGVASAEFLPGVRLVRAFNAVSWMEVNDEAHRRGELIAIPIAGDDAEAVAVTTQLVIDAGFDPVVVGGLERAREFDQGTDVYVKGMTAREMRAALGL
ncbi:MAG: NADPH-dependent F420 reductase [Proteobacteria bacterium]|nr:NADPH-dependent F420 reductase [Pseudomonadota bacterium]